MFRLTSSRVLNGGFLAVLAMLVYAAVEAYSLQSPGGAEQESAYQEFIILDDAVTNLRRAVWLGGIYSRDYLLDRDDDGLHLFRERIRELGSSGDAQLKILESHLPQAATEHGLRRHFEAFLGELQTLADRPERVDLSAVSLAEGVLLPQRLETLAIFEDFRGVVRKELANAQERFQNERREAARTLVFMLAFAVMIAFGVAAFSLRYSRSIEGERERQYAEIARAKRELEDLSARILEVQEEERRSLSQELHDEVGQTLTALRMELSLAIGQARDAATREQIRRSRELVEKTVRIVRNISLMLRPSLLDDLGLGAALQWQLDEFSRRSGISVRFTGAEVGEDLPEAVATCVFRIAQEALNNCEKYAGASRVNVELALREDQVFLEIADDGKGFAVDERGLPFRGTGILGMKERAWKQGGAVTVSTAPGTGTRIQLVLPVRTGVEGAVPAESHS